MKKLIAVAAVIVALAGINPAAASAKKLTFRHDKITFSYPKSWSLMSQSQADALGKQLTNDAKGMLTFSAAGGVDKVSISAHGSIALVARLNFTKRYQKQLKGSRQKFYKRLSQGIRKQMDTKDLKSTTGTFAGSSQAFELYGQVKTDGSWTHDEIFAFIPASNASVDIGIFAVLPPKDWSKYASALNDIAASSRFS